MRETKYYNVSTTVKIDRAKIKETQHYNVFVTEPLNKQNEDERGAT